MNRRPPAVLERLVSWLVPSGSREHVLGDFSEMYRSPAQLRKKPDLQRAGKWLWVMFVLMAFGVFTSPTPNLAGVEIRLMAVASITFVFLLGGRAMQLSEARLQAVLKSSAGV